MNESKREWNTPPAPRLSDCVFPGMIGYRDRKLTQRLEARRDRAQTRAAHGPEKARLAEIERVARLLRYIDVRWIADQIKPWDKVEFKKRVVEAQTLYLTNK